jgi:methyl-accepting chemotaxis protein
MHRLIEFLNKRLELKILALIILILVASFTIIYYRISAKERENLISKEREKSALIADTIHQTLDKDMMAFRADLVRFLMEDIHGLPGIVRLQIVRGDGAYLGDGRGKEQAFQDFKTLEDVRKRITVLYRPEWETNHPKKNMMAPGSDDPRFQEYFKTMIAELSKPGVLANEEKAIRDEGKLDDSYFETVNGAETMTYLRPLPNFPKCALCHGAEHKLRGILMITTSMEGVNLEVQNSQKQLLTLSSITVIILVLLLRAMMKRVVLKPLVEVTERVKDIAEGGGDLTRRITVTYQDEIGAVARWVNVFMEKLHYIMSQVSRTSGQVSTVSQNVLAGTREISDGAKVQMNAVQTTSITTEEMNTSIKAIADRAESLSALTQESAIAILQMSASIDEIAKSSAVLSALVEDTTSSILELSSSVKQIDSNVESLSGAASDSATSMIQMDASIKQIRGNVHDTVRLSKGVTEDAERGRRAVESTVMGINRIQEYSRQVEAVIQSLRARTENIGTILNVIDEVAEQTNLLALNAAIIAAQAGEHGKGFAVVAQEIKELADRTATSTKEIHDIINDLQEESKNAVHAIQRGTQSVEEGVKLSKEAMEALNKILDSSMKSTERIQEIARTTDEQTKGVKYVTEAMQRVNDMVQQIGKATHEQSKGSGIIISNTDKVKEIAIKVKAATQEQALGNKQINEIVERVNRMVKEIAETTGKQAEESGSILKAIERIHAVVQQNVTIISNVSQAVEELIKQAKILSTEIEKFKL